MKDLEQSCRRALRWYPRRWPGQHEEALLGILLDQADAEGRTQMSSPDRRNLARRGLAHRLHPAMVVALLILSGLAMLQLISLLIFRTGLDAQLTFSPPPLHPVPIGTSWVPPFIVDLPGWATYLICTIIALGAATAARLLIRTARKAR